MTDEINILEFARLRDRLNADMPRSPLSSPGGKSPAIVGQIFAQAALPGSTGRFYAAHPVHVLGRESEGEAGIFSSDDSAVFFVDAIGSRPPSIGDLLVCRFVGDRWAAESSFPISNQGINLPGCACVGLPSTLRMTSANPSCNQGLFQSCTIVYGPTPAVYSTLNLGSQSYLSTQKFQDVSGFPFRYYFYCEGSQFCLGRAYEISANGAPFLDSPRYTWKFGSTTAGNSCSPLLLTNGQTPAGDPFCSVTITA